MKLGVFDSGIGGEAVASALLAHFPEAVVTTVNDRAHLPYGDKTAEEIRILTDNAIQPLLGSDIIVIACNSATTAAIDWLRETYPTQLFIGIEPMIKPASEQTTTGIVAVCATPATLASTRYQNLKKKYANHLTVLEPDCSQWAKMIEEDAVNTQTISDQVISLLKQGADVIVLGCTHYHWIKEDIVRFAQGRAVVLEPSEAIANQVERLLGHLR